MLNKKIFLNRQISRIQVRQPNHQFDLFKTSTAAVKKNSRASQVQRPETKKHMQIPDGQKSKLLFSKVWQTYIYLQMCKNISSDTTQSHSLSLSTFSYRQSILKSSCKLTDWTLVWLPSADPMFWELEDLYKNMCTKPSKCSVFFLQFVVAKKWEN